VSASETGSGPASDNSLGRCAVWHGTQCPVTDSYLAAPAASNPNAAYDYFHINSVNLDTDGNLLVSSRHTWTVYKINRTTGALMWKLGGKRSDFALGDGLPFAWQHNAMAVDTNTIRIFDNGIERQAGAAVFPRDLGPARRGHDDGHRRALDRAPRRAVQCVHG